LVLTEGFSRGSLGGRPFDDENAKESGMRWMVVVISIVCGLCFGTWLGMRGKPSVIPVDAKHRAPQVQETPHVATPPVAAKMPDDCTVPSGTAVDAAVRRLRAPGSLAIQNRLAEEHQLPRVADLAELRAYIAKGVFVPLKETDVYRYGDAFAEADPANRTLYAHALPHVAPFLDVLLGEAYRCFAPSMAAADDLRIARMKRDREKLVAALEKRRDKRSKKRLATLDPLDTRPKFDRFPIDSLLRTEIYQRRLLKSGKWPAATGDTAESRTVHTTGSTIDIGLGNLPPHVRDWIRVRLARLEQEGRIDAIEERGRYSVCAHIMILP